MYNLWLRYPAAPIVREMRTAGQRRRGRPSGPGSSNTRRSSANSSKENKKKNLRVARTKLKFHFLLTLAN